MESLSKKISFEISRNPEVGTDQSRHAVLIPFHHTPSSDRLSSQKTNGPARLSTPTPVPLSPISFLLLYGPPSLHILSPLSTTPPLSRRSSVPCGPSFLPTPPSIHHHRRPTSQHHRDAGGLSSTRNPVTPEPAQLNAFALLLNTSLWRSLPHFPSSLAVTCFSIKILINFTYPF